MKTIGLCIAYLIIVNFSSANLEDETPVSVSRRQGGDIYTNFNESLHEICSGDNLTFLVNGRICVKDQELISGCSFAITPSEQNEGPSNCQPVLTIDLHRNQTKFLTTVAPHSFNLTDALIIFSNDSCQTLSSDFCTISSLEVYRGREQIIEISHNGFRLNNKSNIEINLDNLAYDIDEFEGELYRMNLSCPNSKGMSPERGCLFFKQAGTADITKAKFNHSVQGTLGDTHSTDPTLSMTTHTYWTTAPITQTTNSTVTTNSTTITASSAITTEAERGTPEPYITFGSNLIEVGNALFYIVVGAGSGVLILLLVILIMCMAVCCLVADKGKSYTITTAAMHTQQIQCGERDSRNPDRRWPQTQGLNQILRVEPVSQQSILEAVHLTLSSRHNTNGEDYEREHAKIEDHNPSPPPLPPPDMTESMDEERTIIESIYQNYQAHVSIPSHLRRSTKRGSNTAELAYLYERNDAEFGVPKCKYTDDSIIGSLNDQPNNLEGSSSK